MLDPTRLAIWQDAMNRPSIPIPVGSLNASTRLFSVPCILAGFTFRESGAGSGSITWATASGTAANAASQPLLSAPGAGLTNWLTGFEVTGTGATAGGVVVFTIAGLIGGTKSYVIAVPAGVTTAIQPLVVEFPYPGIPALGPNQAIQANLPAFGAGNTNVAVTLNGYVQSPGVNAGVVSSAPTAAFNIRDGYDASAPVVAGQDLAAGGSVQVQSGRDGPICREGLFLEILAGTVAGTVWVKPLPDARP